MTSSANSVALTIPRPPSVNAAYGNRAKGQKGRGRYPLPALLSWRDAAGKTIIAAGKMPRIVTPVIVTIKAVEPDDNRRRDGDNIVKPILDLLVSMGIILDDGRKFVRKTSVEWIEGGPTDAVIVELTETTGPASKKKAVARDPRIWAQAQIKRKLGVEVALHRIRV